MMPILPDEPEEPVLIVAAEEKQPEWMVMADQVQGAASRRVKTKKRVQTSAPEQASQNAQVHEAQPAQEAPQPMPRAPRQQPAHSTLPEDKVLRAKSPQKSKTKRAPRKETKAERARRIRRLRRTTIGTAAGLVLLSLILFAAAGIAKLVDIKQTLDRGDGVFYPNISVNDIPLAGLSLDEAAYVVSSQVAQKIASWKITLKTQDGQQWDITGEDLGMKYDVADQLDQLWTIGHTGSASERYARIKQLSENPEVRYTTLSYDMTGINQILTKIKSEIDRPAVNATRVEDDSLWPPFTYTDDIPGQELDITGFNERISEMVNKLESGVVDLVPSPVAASVTREALEGQIVELSTFDTTVGATSEPGRFINIEVGTKKFNHLRIKAGETVSFNKVAGRRTYENGYADAPELAYGDYRTGVGGGICQVSSTLYNAVVNAGLQVNQRTQHSLASNYVDMGLDATVQDDRLDFVFTNNTGAEIFISSEYYKKGNYYHCRFTIHGRPDPNGYTYKLESQVVEEIPIPEPTYIPDTEAQYVVYDDETKETFKGEKGYIVDVYKVTLDSTGRMVDRVLDHTDTYNTRQPRVYVGVTPRETPVPDWNVY